MMSTRSKAEKPLSLTAPRRGFGGHVIRLSDLVLARAETALAPLGLKPLALDTMFCILDGEGLSQQGMSRQLGIRAPKMVGVLDGLENQGLVERNVSPSDRRRHVLRLTPKGHALAKRASAIAAALERELFGCVPEEDKARFALLVKRLEQAERAAESD